MACNKVEEAFNEKGERMLVIFNSLQDKKQVLAKYSASYHHKVKTWLGMQDKDKVYCEGAPQPSEIIWQNIGSGDSYKLKYKVLSMVYFLLLLIGSYILLFFCMELVYQKWLEEPWNFIMINIILTFVVFVAMSFRAWMNKLSELSHPSIYTNRTMFIVMTTISFHLLFYIIIPTFYFSLAED